MPTVVPIDQLNSFMGKSLNPSDWLVMDQSRIHKFADATDDHQFIHIDPAAAEKTPLGGTIAHGLLTLSLLPKLVEQCMLVPEGTTMGINYGFDKVRFLNPVRPGDALRLKATVVDVQIKPESGDKEIRVLTKLAVTLEIKSSEQKILKKPALICEWLNLFVCAAMDKPGQAKMTLSEGLNKGPNKEQVLGETL